MQALCASDFSNEAFPLATSQEVEIGNAIVRAARIELCVSADQALQAIAIGGTTSALKTRRCQPAWASPAPGTQPPPVCRPRS